MCVFCKVWLFGVKHQDRGLACGLTLQPSFSSLISSWTENRPFSLYSLDRYVILNLNSSKMSTSISKELPDILISYVMIQAAT